MEEKKNTFEIINDQGEKITCEVLFTFDSEETNKSYIAYTDNSLDDSGNVKVFASIYDKTGENKELLPIESEKEWLLVESIFSKIQEKVSETSGE